jgi:hypothetical protein
MTSVKASAALRVYHILLILTDGEIHDMALTQKLIVEASHYPCSIIKLELEMKNLN